MHWWNALAYPLGMSVWSLGIAVAMLAWLSIGLGWGKPALRARIAMAVVGLFTHTSDAAQYGIWRVLNTIIGVSIGVAVSRLVWPVRGRDEVAGAIDRALAATMAALDGLARGASSDALRPLQLEVLDTLAELKTARTNALDGAAARSKHGPAERADGASRARCDRHLGRASSSTSWSRPERGPNVCRRHGMRSRRWPHMPKP